MSVSRKIGRWSIPSPQHSLRGIGQSGATITQHNGSSGFLAETPDDAVWWELYRRPSGCMRRCNRRCNRTCNVTTSVPRARRGPYPLRVTQRLVWLYKILTPSPLPPCGLITGTLAGMRLCLAAVSSDFNWHSSLCLMRGRLNHQMGRAPLEAMCH